MNKGELLEELAKKSGVSKADVAKVVDAFTTAVTGALKKDDSVVLVGFGTFQARRRAARAWSQPPDRGGNQDCCQPRARIQGRRPSESSTELSAYYSGTALSVRAVSRVVALLGCWLSFPGRSDERSARSAVSGSNVGFRSFCYPLVVSRCHC